LNPIISLLAKNRRYLQPQHIGAILAAINMMGDKPFKLSDLDPLLPEDLTMNRKARRSITSLLNLLAKIGYLSRPSQRTYQRRFNSLSQMLSESLFELADIEKRVVKPIKSEKIIKLGEAGRVIGARMVGGKQAGRGR
jgi:hypothetical protein